ncbi:MAG: D-alanine--D-alanine ligase [Actinomycetota bacterium]|nr:D-alanine--D-alanine ligase [Actinomycetota bacterium]
MAGRVVVASGGRSLEREISLRSGRRATDALQALGYDAVAVDPDHGFVAQIKELRPSFVFVAMHGRGGEDGTLQDLLEILGVPYTGSDVHASARCLDKHAFKELMVGIGLATPVWHSFNRDAFAAFGAADTLPELIAQLGFPLVVKPAREGSSLGIKFVNSNEEFSQAVVGALSYDDRVVIEHFIEGRELAATVLGPPDAPEVLPVVEIRTEEPFYTFRAHYDPGAAEMEVADLSPETRTAVETAAREAYTAAGCRDFARVDLILDRDETPQILEINTIPGLTETGPARFAAEAAGMDFQAFIERVVGRAASEAGAAA